MSTVNTVLHTEERMKSMNKKDLKQYIDYLREFARISTKITEQTINNMLEIVNDLGINETLQKANRIWIEKCKEAKINEKGN